MSDINKNEPDQPESSEAGKKGKKQLQKRVPAEEYRLIPVEENSYDDSDDEVLIDVIGTLKDIWINRTIVYITTAVVFVIGLLIYFGSDRIYYSEAQLMPESSSNQSQLGQLFQQYENIFGIQRSVEENDIQVSMYPHIVESLRFQIELMQHKVYFGELEQELTIFEYFTEYYNPPFTSRITDFVWDYTIALPFTAWNFIKSLSSDSEKVQEPIDFAQFREFEAPKILDSQIKSVASTVSALITISREPQTGFVSIGVSLPDAQASTEMVILVKNLLQEYVIDYRTEKAMNNLVFIEEQFEEARVNFQAKQDSLAAFQDRNVNVATSSMAVVEQRLQSEYELAYTLYNTLARRLQEAKIQVQEQTPVFRVHEPAIVPTQPAEPDAIRILGGAIFVGLFLGVAFIYLRRWFGIFVQEFKNKDPKPYKV
ncbi:GNVR domain-containing protein [Rhodohalobacter sp. 614A]|uniref:GNVR domain-containing protein n=1 Tax=Rhodohalobacter sp. 614A TaxID=2908649 RepID=UPI001F285C33